MYRTAIISFIDILGFKNLVNNSTYEQLSEKLETVRRLSGDDDGLNGEGLEPKVIQFSDSIIRIRPLDSDINKETPYGVMFYEMLDLVHMQSELINHGVCVRGGVSIGKVHFDDYTLFGPGFVSAYEMESLFANYPRIVIDPVLIQLLGNDSLLFSDHNSVDDELRSIKKNITKGSDGLYFVDYLRSFQTEVDHAEDIPLFLNNHRQIIIKNASGANNLTSVSAKYLWMSTYHNEVVNELCDKWLENFGLSKRELLISTDDIPMLKAL